MYISFLMIAHIWFYINTMSKYQIRSVYRESHTTFIQTLSLEEVDLCGPLWLCDVTNSPLSSVVCFGLQCFIKLLFFSTIKKIALISSDWLTPNCCNHSSERRSQPHWVGFWFLKPQISLLMDFKLLQMKLWINIKYETLACRGQWLNPVNRTMTYYLSIIDTSHIKAEMFDMAVAS